MNKKLKSRLALFILSLVLFVACITVSLKSSGYVLPFGWKPSAQKVAPTDAYAGNYAICDRDLVEQGFPLTFMRPYDDLSDCTDQYNVLAIVFDVLVALAISLGASLVIIKTAGKMIGK